MFLFFFFPSVCAPQPHAVLMSVTTTATAGLFLSGLFFCFFLPIAKRMRNLHLSFDLKGSGGTQEELRRESSPSQRRLYDTELLQPLIAAACNGAHQTIVLITCNTRFYIKSNEYNEMNPYQTKQ